MKLTQQQMDDLRWVAEHRENIEIFKITTGALVVIGLFILNSSLMSAVSFTTTALDILGAVFEFFMLCAILFITYHTILKSMFQNFSKVIE